MAQSGEIENGSLQSGAIDQILAPRGIKAFLSEVWGRSPLHLAGQAGRFEHLLSWRELNRLLEEYPLDSKRLRVFRNGKRLAEELYRTPTLSLDAGMLSSLLGHGATLVIDFIDDIWPSIGRVADAFAEAIGARTSVNLYASWGTESGFSLHSDSHDVIVLQLNGSKHWTVYHPARIDPLEGYKFEAPLAGQEPAWSGELGDGDVLYIPRGWPHIVAPTGDPSFHLTIGLTQPNGSAFLRWLAQELDETAAIRAAIPRSGDARDQWIDQARMLVDQKISRESVDSYLRSDLSRQLARRQFALPNFARAEAAEWTGETRFRLASTRRLDLKTTGADMCVIEAAGRNVPCPNAIADALASLSSADSVSLDALEHGLSADTIQHLKRTLAILMQLGLLFCEPATGDEP